MLTYFSSLNKCRQYLKSKEMHEFPHVINETSPFYSQKCPSLDAKL